MNVSSAIPRRIMAQHSVSLTLNGREYSIETGRFAKLANGAVMVRHGDTMVLVTACASQDPKPDIDFLPLTVEYREKAAAAGKIPGGFFKREGKPSEKEILSARLIDRPARPLFPKGWRFETQLVASIYSSEPEIDADTLAAVGASAALVISDIPFSGPYSEVMVGRVNGEFICNPTMSQLLESDIEIVVAGTDEAIMMVEGSSKEISEEDFIAALEFAHATIKQLNALQLQLRELAGKAKRDFDVVEDDEALLLAVKAIAAPLIKEQIRKDSIKEQRIEFAKSLRETVLNALQEAEPLEVQALIDARTKKVKGYISKIEKHEMRRMIIEDKRRLDGRKTTDIRSIECNPGLLPRTHGSALFTRGETQSLSTVTLGTKRDEQMIDGLFETEFRRFMLHYNFPPFSTGEAGRMTGTSRREIGHGKLAERALKVMMPSDEDFPYVVRIISDILESNGSSSMATVCAGSLALMDAGVPVKKAVAGIAMGLIMEEDDSAILSDILGDEDFLGDMDFKVAGTVEGITACQMDIKIGGLSTDLMRRALDQARHGRLHILSIMNESLSVHRSDLSQFAPRLTTIMIAQDMIGTVIGPGGDTIRGMQREFGVEITIEDDGSCIIAATNQEAAQKTIDRIKVLTSPPEVGKVYTATVKDVREGLGAIVEFMPKTKGLLHISQISYEHFQNVGDVLKVGQQIDVKLLEIQSDGKFRLSHKVLLTPPEGYVEPQRQERPRRDDRGGRGGYDRDRGGRGGYDRDRGPRRDDRPRDERPREERPREERPSDDRRFED
jgi:polyribonucleotide nucleotidyltransferase